MSIRGARGRGNIRATRGTRGQRRGRGQTRREVEGPADFAAVVVPTDGDNERAQQVLQNIVNNIPISQEHQELLHEEAMEVMEESQQENSASPICVAPAQTSTQPSLPGDPIPLFTILSWRAQWRRAFFTDWRWAKDKKNKDAMQIWARCKTGKCAGKNPPYYYSGSSKSFTNFEKHLNSAHPTKYEEFSKSSKKDESQTTVLEFIDRPVVTSKARQKRLDTGFTLAVAIDNIPPNIVRRPNFRKWIHV